MDRFQNTTRHTEMLPRIPINVVIPSKIPMIRTIPDSGILCRGNVVNVVKGGPASRIDDLEFISKLEMRLISVSNVDFYCK